MAARSQLGTRTLILWESTAPGPTWEAGGTRTATRPTSMVFMAQTVIIRYDSSLMNLVLSSVIWHTDNSFSVCSTGSSLDRLER